MQGINQSYFDIAEEDRLRIYKSSWTYDDLSRAVILWSNSFKKSFSGVVPSKQKEKAFVNALLKRKELSTREKENDKLKLHVGHPYYKEQARECLDRALIQASLQEFYEMLFSCGHDRKNAGEMLKIVLGMLSGYTARLFSTRVSDDEIAMKNLRAPVILVRKHDGRWELLKKVTESLTVQPVQDYENEDCWIKMDLPAVVYSSNHRVHTNDLTCVRFFYQKSTSYFDYVEDDYDIPPRIRKEKLELPVQYRDSVVLLYRTQLEHNLKPFLQRNRWASIILYAASSNPLPTDSLKVDVSRLRTSNFDWDSSLVQSLIQEFVAKLSAAYGEKRLTQLLNEIWIQAKHLVEKHNSVRGSEKVQGQQKIWMCLMMASLLLLAVFIRNALCRADPSNYAPIAERLFAELSNLLLPGSCDAPPCNVPIGERPIDIQRDADEILQEILKNLISPEFSAHLCFVPPKGLFDLVDPEDGGTKYWGYLRQHFDRYHKPSYFALQIRKDQMEEIGNQLFPSRCDWEELIQQLKKKMPPYLCFIRPESMPIDEMERAAKKTATALTFDIGKLDFLSEEGKKYLHNRFLGMEDQAAWADASEAGIEQPDSVQNEEAADETSVFDEIEEL